MYLDPRHPRPFEPALLNVDVDVGIDLNEKPWDLSPTSINRFFIHQNHWMHDLLAVLDLIETNRKTDFDPDRSYYFYCYFSCIIENRFPATMRCITLVST